MEGGSLTNIKQKAKTTAAKMSEDMLEPMASLNKGGSSCYTAENALLQDQPSDPAALVGSGAAENALLQDQPSDPAALVGSGGDDAGGSASVSNPPPMVTMEGKISGDIKISYPCRYCESQFSTAQALGGHQNTHRYVREQAKKQKVEGYTPSGSSLEQQPRVIYPKYGGSSNSITFGHPKVLMYNPNNFSLPRSPFVYPHSMQGFPTIQYPQSTIGLTFGQPGQPYNNIMLNSRQLPVFNSSRMIRPNIVNNVNTSYTSGNINFGGAVVRGQGGVLDGLRAQRANMNSMGMVGVRGRGCINVDCRTPRGYDCFPSVGFGATNTSRGVVRNFFKVSRGDQSNVRGHEESDGTIDLLSRVGMRRGEDGESNGKRGNGGVESQ